MPISQHILDRIVPRNVEDEQAKLAAEAEEAASGAVAAQQQVVSQPESIDEAVYVDYLNRARQARGLEPAVNREQFHFARAIERETERGVAAGVKKGFQSATASTLGLVSSALGQGGMARQAFQIAGQRGSEIEGFAGKLASGLTQAVISTMPSLVGGGVAALAARGLARSAGQKAATAVLARMGTSAVAQKAARAAAQKAVETVIRRAGLTGAAAAGGFQSGAAGYAEALLEGKTPGDALITGTLKGGATAFAIAAMGLTGAEALLRPGAVEVAKRTLKNAAAEFTTQGVGEASEESIDLALNLVIDYARDGRTISVGEALEQFGMTGLVSFIVGGGAGGAPALGAAVRQRGETRRQAATERARQPGLQDLFGRTEDIAPKVTVGEAPAMGDLTLEAGEAGPTGFIPDQRTLPAMQDIEAAGRTLGDAPVLTPVEQAAAPVEQGAVGPVPPQPATVDVGRPVDMSDAVMQEHVKAVDAMFPDVPAMAGGTHNIVANGMAVELGWGEGAGKTLVVPVTRAEMDGTQTGEGVFRSLGVADGDSIVLNGTKFTNDAAGRRNRKLRDLVSTPGAILVDAAGASKTGYDSLIYAVVGADPAFNADARTLQHELIHRQTMTKPMSDNDVGAVQDYLVESGRSKAIAAGVKPRSLPSFHENLVKLYFDWQDGKVLTQSEADANAKAAEVRGIFQRVKAFFAKVLGFADSKAKAQQEVAPDAVVEVLRRLHAGELQAAPVTDVGLPRSATLTSRILVNRRTEARKEQRARLAPEKARQAEERVEVQAKTLKRRHTDIQAKTALDAVFMGLGARMTSAATKLAQRITPVTQDRVIDAAKAIQAMPDGAAKDAARSRLHDAIVAVDSLKGNDPDIDMFVEALRAEAEALAAGDEAMFEVRVVGEEQRLPIPTVTRMGSGAELSPKAKALMGMMAMNTQGHSAEVLEAVTAKANVLSRRMTHEGIVDLAESKLGIDNTLPLHVELALHRTIASLGTDDRVALTRDTKTAQLLERAVKLGVANSSLTGTALNFRKHFQQIVDTKNPAMFGHNVMQTLSSLTKADQNRIARLPEAEREAARLKAITEQVQKFNRLLSERVPDGVNAMFALENASDPAFQAIVQETLLQATHPSMSMRVAAFISAILSGRTGLFGMRTVTGITGVSWLTGFLDVSADWMRDTTMGLIKGDLERVIGAQRGVAGAITSHKELPRAWGRAVAEGKNYAMEKAGGVPTDLVREQGQSHSPWDIVFPGQNKAHKAARATLDLMARLVGATDQSAELMVLAYQSQTRAREIAKRNKISLEDAVTSQEFIDYVMMEMAQVGAVRAMETATTASGERVSYLETFADGFERLIRSGLGLSVVSPQAGIIARGIVQQERPVVRGPMRGWENTMRWIPIANAGMLARDALILRNINASDASAGKKLFYQQRTLRSVTQVLITNALLAGLIGLSDEEEIDKLGRGVVGDTDISRLPAIGFAAKSWGKIAAGVRRAIVEGEGFDEDTGRILAQAAKLMAEDLYGRDRYDPAYRTPQTFAEYMAGNTVHAGRLRLMHKRAQERGMTTEGAFNWLYSYVQTMQPISEIVDLLDNAEKPEAQSALRYLTRLDEADTRNVERTEAAIRKYGEQFRGTFMRAEDDASKKGGTINPEWFRLTAMLKDAEDKGQEARASALRSARRKVPKYFGGRR